MTKIFECETIVGKCSCETANGELLYAEPDYAVIYACTIAQLNGHRGILKVEHVCLLRHGSTRPDQPWIDPAIRLEPATGPRERLVEASQRWHEEFVERVRTEFPDEYFL